MPESVQLAGFYGRQALRCRLLARRAAGSQAVALTHLAEEYERAARVGPAGGASLHAE